MPTFALWGESMVVDDKLALSNKFNKEGNWYPIEEAGEILIKPYLRPMSSMTDEERDEYEGTFASVYDVNDYGEDADSWHEEFSIDSLDYLNAHHFDYRGLIEKGLALEAPEGMYN